MRKPLARLYWQNNVYALSYCRLQLRLQQPSMAYVILHDKPALWRQWLANPVSLSVEYQGQTIVFYAVVARARLRANAVISLWLYSPEYLLQQLYCTYCFHSGYRLYAVVNALCAPAKLKIIWQGVEDQPLGWLGLANQHTYWQVFLHILRQHCLLYFIQYTLSQATLYITTPAWLQQQRATQVLPEICHASFTAGGCVSVFRTEALSCSARVHISGVSDALYVTDWQIFYRQGLVKKPKCIAKTSLLLSSLYLPPLFRGLALAEVVENALPDSTHQLFMRLEDPHEQRIAGLTWQPLQLTVLQRRFSNWQQWYFSHEVGSQVLLCLASEVKASFVLGALYQQQKPKLVQRVGSQHGQKAWLALYLGQACQWSWSLAKEAHTQLFCKGKIVAMAKCGLQLTSRRGMLWQAMQQVHLHGRRMIWTANRSLQLRVGSQSLEINERSIALLAMQLILKVQGGPQGILARASQVHQCGKANAGHSIRQWPAEMANVLIEGVPLLRANDRLFCTDSWASLQRMNPALLIAGQPVAMARNISSHGGQLSIPKSRVWLTRVDARMQRATIKKMQVLKLSFVSAQSGLWPLHQQVIVSNGCDQLPFLPMQTSQYMHQLVAGVKLSCMGKAALAPAIVAVNQHWQLPAARTCVPEKWQGDKLRLKLLWPLMVVDLRDTQDLLRRYGLPSVVLQAIDYFSAAKAPAIIFIHGFNVAKGCLGRYLDPVASQDSVYADVYQQPRPADRYDRNGRGAYSWFLHMEQHFNGMSGEYHFSQPKAYQYYRRCLHVSWPGNPSAAWQYLAAEPAAFAAGKRLANIVLALYQAGIRVQVVAHSLGCAVLYSLLSKLAEKNDAVIERAVMWQAAIPSNAFCRSAQQPWGDYRALRACKQLAVLYSRNDNVLGPMLRQQPAGVDECEVQRAKPLSELLPALLFRALGFESLYVLAHHLSLPPQSLFDSAVQKQLYHHWLSLYPKRCAPSGGSMKQKRQWLQQGLYLPDFDEQVHYACYHYHAYYQKFLERLQQLAPRLNRELAQAHWGADNAVDAAYHQWLIEGVELLIGALDWLSASVTMSENWGYFVSLLKRGQALFVDTLLAHTVVMRMACLLYMLHDVVPLPMPAMGYVGFKCQDGRQPAGKLLQIDQTRRLWSHSAMKQPDDALLYHLFHELLYQQVGLRLR